MRRLEISRASRCELDVASVGGADKPVVRELSERPFPVVAGGATTPRMLLLGDMNSTFFDSWLITIW